MNVKGTVIDTQNYYVCQRCTACCKWPGDVRVEADEIPLIAEYLNLSEQEFIDTFTRLRSNRKGLSIIEKSNHECIMLENGGCRIHAVKPEQCKGFPNSWNFPGWQKTCDAKAIPREEAKAQGLLEED